MKKLSGFYWVLLTAPLCVALSGCDTDSNLADPDLSYFVKYYGADGNQSGRDMLVLEDGSFFLLGDDAKSTVDSDLYMLRVDAEGEVIWESRIGQEEAGSIWLGKDVEPASDGNFIVLADYQAPGTNHRDIRILKISPEGQLLDSAGLGTPAHDYGLAVTPLQDGGLIVSGMTEYTATFGQRDVPVQDQGDSFKFRLDQNLEKTHPNDWNVFVGFGGRLDALVKVIEKSPSEFHAFGYTNANLLGSNVNERTGMMYFRIDGGGIATDPAMVLPAAGNVTISFVYPLESAYGGGVLAIGTAADNLGQSNIFMTRLRTSLTFNTSTGNDLLFSDAIRVGRNIRGVSATSAISAEQGFLILGDEVRVAGTTNIWLMKVSPNGSPLWSATLGSESVNDRGAAVKELPDGRIVILGTMGLADNQLKMALIKVNRRGRFLK